MTLHRLMSGMRPTGKLHIGHLLGALENWKRLQESYECFFMVADLHALTTGYRNSKEIPENIQEMVLDWLACGINPEKSTMYIQSHVPEISEIYTLLDMTIPIAWLERVPSYKDQIQELGQDIATHGFLGYPLLQTADIVSIKGNVVPVGQDQLPHLELAREIIRRFHFIFGKEIFPEPEALLSQAPFVPGIDGRKMSKSYNNSILISDAPEAIQEKIKQAVTDPEKIHKSDPGHPDICNIYFYHRFFSSPEIVNEVNRTCRSGELGCVADKKHIAAILAEQLAPIREKRAQFAQKPKLIQEILTSGAKKARTEAQKTLSQMKELMHLA